MSGEEEDDIDEPASQPPPCPRCAAPHAKRIVYGYPSEETEREAREGRFVLGGCCVSDEMSRWHCAECGHEFGTIEFRRRRD